MNRISDVRELRRNAYTSGNHYDCSVSIKARIERPIRPLDVGFDPAVFFSSIIYFCLLSTSMPDFFKEQDSSANMNDSAWQQCFRKRYKPVFSKAYDLKTRDPKKSLGIFILIERKDENTIYY